MDEYKLILSWSLSQFVSQEEKMFQKQNFVDSFENQELRVIVDAENENQLYFDLRRRATSL